MMAFFNHFNPKRSKSVPMTVRRISRGTHWTSATPRVATSRARVAAAAKAPSSALRQLTVTPTTRTMVKASTNSTAEAKNAAVKTTHCIEREAPFRDLRCEGYAFARIFVCIAYTRGVKKSVGWVVKTGVLNFSDKARDDKGENDTQHREGQGESDTLCLTLRAQRNGRVVCQCGT